MIRFALKCGLAVAAMHYTAEQGVWRDSETTSKLYESYKKQACPYIKKMNEQLPFELPKLPKSDVSGLGRVSWNSGVKATCGFLVELPSHASSWASSVRESLESFNNAPSLPDSPNK